jgi:hypothetical protein
MICGPQYVVFHVKRFQFHVEQPGGHTAAHVSVVVKCLVGVGTSIHSEERISPEWISADA